MLSRTRAKAADHFVLQVADYELCHGGAINASTVSMWSQRRPLRAHLFTDMTDAIDPVIEDTHDGDSRMRTRVTHRGLSIPAEIRRKLGITARTSLDRGPGRQLGACVPGTRRSGCGSGGPGRPARCAASSPTDAGTPGATALAGPVCIARRPPVSLCAATSEAPTDPHWRNLRGISRTRAKLSSVPSSGTARSRRKSATWRGQ